MEKPKDARRVASKFAIDESKNFQKLYNSWRRHDLFVTIFAMSGLIAALANYELDVINKYNTGRVINEEDFNPNAMESDRF